MKPALVAIVFIATAGITAAADFTANDLVGAWTLGVADKNYAYYTFRSDHTYNGSEGDMLFEGKWRVVGRSRLKKILLTGSRFELIVIDSFAGDTLRVTLPDGKKDVWKKMPRWRGSPKY